MNKPIFIDPKLRSTFERLISRPASHPEIWGDQPINRLFLLFGQKGTCMDEALVQLTMDYNVPFVGLRITKDAKEMSDTFKELIDPQRPFIPLLIIRKGHLLKYHTSLFLTTFNLKKIPNIGFIFVISEEVPDESVFWEQFKIRIPMGLPKKNHYKELLSYYFNHWASSKSPAVGPIDLDYEELAISCDYATPNDVKRFVRSVISYVIDQYPDNKVIIDMDLLKNGFMFASLGVKELLCITNKDGHALQLKFDPTGATNAPSVDDANLREKKRVKAFIEGEGAPE